MAKGLEGITGTPRADTRQRRNWQRMAADFVALLGDGLGLSGAGLISVSLATDPGLEFSSGDLRVKVAAPIIRNASGVGLSFGTGLQNDAGVLKSKDSEIVHDNLSGFVADEHIAHSGVSITGTGVLAGGGNIAASRTISLTFGTGLQNDGGTLKSKDSEIDHDALLNFVADEHIAHSGVTLTAGIGLSGGGTIAANRTFAVDINGLTADATPDGAADYVMTHDGSASTLKKVLLNDLPGGGGVGGGATFPASPSDGDVFLHTPTGRNIWYVYKGSTWYPIRSVGDMTVYVDATDGTDDADHGTGVDSNAFATVQYAIDMIPGTVGGNVYIYVNAESYAEDVTIQGKNFTGTFSINITGTASTLDSLTAASGVQGSPGTQGTVVRNSGTWTSNQRQNKWARFTSGNNNGVRRVIDSNTTDTITIAGAWDGSIASGDTFVVEEPATTIQSIYVGAGQVSVNITSVAFNFQSSFNYMFYTFSQGTVTFCRQIFASDAAIAVYKAYAVFSQCYFEQTRLFCGYGAFTRLSGCKFYKMGTSGCASQTTDCSTLLVDQGTIHDGASEAGSTAVFLYAFGILRTGDHYIRNWATGIYALSGGVAVNTAAVQYSGNTTDENPSGASDPSYID